MGTRATGERLERMKASAQWAETGFRNIYPIAPGLRDTQAPFPGIKDFLCPDPSARRTPAQPLPTRDPRAAWHKPPASGLRATWLGHSTVLLEMDGHRVLTDPVWGTRASPFRLVGPRRFQPMPVALADLPEVDVVVISHDHYDHLDYPTIRALRKSSVPFVTSLGVGAHLQHWGIAPERITELDWWEQHAVPGTGLRIQAAPSQHFSGRGLKDRNATLWSSMVVSTDRHRVFFSGDTGLTHEYTAIRERLGPFDLVMLEVGAHHPAWGDMHLGPHNAMQAWSLLGGGAFLPVHWGTFALAMHAWDQPAEVLLQEASRHTSPLLLPPMGQPVEPAQGPVVEPWWRSPATGLTPAETAVPPGGGAEPPELTPRLTERMPWPLD